jgi:hypothetical protein
MFMAFGWEAGHVARICAVERSQHRARVMPSPARCVFPAFRRSGDRRQSICNVRTPLLPPLRHARMLDANSGGVCHDAVAVANRGLPPTQPLVHGHRLANLHISFGPILSLGK